MIIKRSSFENEKSKSQKKTNGRSGARNLKFHNLHLKRDVNKNSREVNQTFTSGTTTVRSELQNHIEEIRTNNHIRNTPSKTQIKAKDLNDYLRVSPIDLKIERK